MAHRDTNTTTNTDNAEIALVVSCLCDAVETLEQQQPQQQQQPLLDIYGQRLWQQPLETTMDTATRWSLMRRRHHHSHHHRDRITIAAITQEWQRLIQSTLREPLCQQLQSQHQRLLLLLDAQADTQPPVQLKVEKAIHESELETRWSVDGTPLPLRRNILGERYATVDRPLAYRKRHSSAVEIFQQLRPRLKEELRTREMRRIQRLNQHKIQQLHTQKAKQDDEITISPEDVLESRLDQLLDVPPCGDNNSTDM